MATKKILTIGAIAILLSLVFFVCHLLLAPTVLKNKFELIRDGMTRDDVENLFGRPADDVTTLPEGRKGETWLSGDCRADILFDDKGRLVQKHWFEPHRQKSWLQVWFQEMFGPRIRE